MDRHNRTDETVKRFDRICGYGIQPAEVTAASTCLRRELGRCPTLAEVAEFLEQYIAWRQDVIRWRNGELIISRVLTEKGNRIREIGTKVTNIFLKWKRKGGE